MFLLGIVVLGGIVLGHGERKAAAHSLLPAHAARCVTNPPYRPTIIPAPRGSGKKVTLLAAARWGRADGGASPNRTRGHRERTGPEDRGWVMLGAGIVVHDLLQRLLVKAARVSVVMLVMAAGLAVLLRCKEGARSGGQPANTWEGAPPDEPAPVDAAARAAPQPAPRSFKVVHVFVALCDNRHQGIVPVRAELGNGQDPRTNLYWGARQARGVGARRLRERRPGSPRLHRGRRVRRIKDGAGA